MNKLFPFLLMAGLAINLKSKKAWSAPETAKPYLVLFRQTEVKNNLPKNLLLRMAYQESHFRNDIIRGSYVSKAGALGIMQIIPKWHPNVDPLNPNQAIPYAGKYVAKLYKRFGNWKDAIAAYNWGETNLAKFKRGKIKSIPLETRNYISQISADVNGV